MALKHLTLKPLIDSCGGIHLTAYVVNQGGKGNLNTQLHQVLKQCRDSLLPVMPASQVEEFLAPIQAAANKPALFKSVTGNIGLFRNARVFRVLNIPTKVSSLCQVASTFHVKPLLRWLQEDPDFLILAVGEQSARVSLCSQTSAKTLAVFESPFGQTFELEAMARWFHAWVRQLPAKVSPKLFVAGQAPDIERVLARIQYSPMEQVVTTEAFNPDQIMQVLPGVRAAVKAQATDLITKTLREVRCAQDRRQVRFNLYDISVAAAIGKIEKLVVSDGVSIFGKLNKRSGLITIHPCDLDHEDDDLLDDLAQLVLDQGGEVVVASHEDMPGGRPALAIVKDEEPLLTQSFSSPWAQGAQWGSAVARAMPASGQGGYRAFAGPVGPAIWLRPEGSVFSVSERRKNNG